MNKKLMSSVAIAISSVLLMSGCSVSDQKDSNQSGKESTVEEKSAAVIDKYSFDKDEANAEYSVEIICLDSDAFLLIDKNGDRKGGISTKRYSERDDDCVENEEK